MRTIHLTALLCLAAWGTEILGATTTTIADRSPASAPAVRPTKIFSSAIGVEPSKSPAASVHGLFLGRVGKSGTNLATGTANQNGASVQDITLQFSGSYDNLFSGLVSFGNLAAGMNIREAYGKTIALPVLSFKMGQFLANFGKNNRIYPHAQHLIDHPLIVQELFGSATNIGFSSVGVEADLVIPVPWYFDISIAVLNARLSNFYSSVSDNTVAPVFRMEHDFPVNDQTSFGVGGSFSLGDNAVGEITTLAGADMTLTFEHSPKTFGFSWVNEFITANRKSVGGTSNSTYGFYTEPLLRFAPSFWAGIRFDLVHREVANINITQENAIIAWVPSDVSTLRLQGGIRQTTNQDGAWSLLLQYNMTLGTHPAHPY